MTFNSKKDALIEVLQKLKKYGVNPYKIEKDLNHIVCTKTLYNYMNGETKPSDKICDLLFEAIKARYAKLYSLIVAEIQEENGGSSMLEYIRQDRV